MKNDELSKHIKIYLNYKVKNQQLSLKTHFHQVREICDDYYDSYEMVSKKDGVVYKTTKPSYSVEHIVEKYNLECNSELFYLLHVGIGEVYKTCEFCGYQATRYLNRSSGYSYNDCNHIGICKSCDKPASRLNDDTVCKDCIVEEPRIQERTPEYLLEVLLDSNIMYCDFKNESDPNVHHVYSIIKHKIGHITYNELDQVIEFVGQIKKQLGLFKKRATKND